MPSNTEYAQLASRVYVRTDPNRTPLPSGWNPLLPIGEIPDTTTNTRGQSQIVFRR